MWKLDFFIIKCTRQQRGNPEALVLALVNKCCDCTIINRRWLGDIDFLAIHSSCSCSTEYCYWFIISQEITDMLLTTVRTACLNASYLFQPGQECSYLSFQHWEPLSGRWSRICHPLSWNHLLSHQRGLVLVLAQLTPSLIPPCHTMAAVLQLHPSLDEDNLALLMRPRSKNPSESFQILGLFRVRLTGPSAAHLRCRTVQQ